MSKAKHTAAPWSIKPGVTKGAWIGHKNAPAALACGNTKEEAMANARLIAEAPTLKDYLSSARVVLARMRRSMMAHPDHEVGSEFDDLTTESQILEDEIMELLKKIEG